MWKPVLSIASSFVGGWILWFWLDKQGPVYRYATQHPAGDSLVQDLQAGVDMLKAGHPGPSFVYLWNSHPLVMAVVSGLLLSLLLGGLGSLLQKGMRYRAARQRNTPP